MPSPRAEWKGRTAFAEYAEALGVATDQILAAAGQPFGVLVVYSPDRSRMDRLHVATFTRQLDGLLAQVDTPRELHGLWDAILRELQDDE